jgi:putative ABC transport system permease protein
MISPRWRKILADLRLSRSRTALVILSIAIGVFAVGVTLTARDVMGRGIDRAFDDANLASSVIMTDSFSNEIVDAAQALPEIADAEGRASLSVRMLTDDATSRNLTLNVMSDFGDIRVNRIVPEDGAWPPEPGEILLERMSAADAGLTTGDQVSVETPDGIRNTLTVSGLVYDPGEVDPSIGSGELSGYMTLETLAELGQPVAFNRLLLLAADAPRELRQGEFVAGLARDEVLEPAGITVQRIAVHDSPRYHTQALGDALILVMGLLGGLILLLGVFLVINTVNALMSQQVRQIGMMKAIGGQHRQIAAIYLVLVLAYGLLAALFAIPLAALAASAFVGFFGGMLNITVQGPWFPPTVLAIQLALGLLVPLLAALVPVLRGTRISVREAITSYGLTDNQSHGGLIDRVIGRIRGLSRPVMLSVRNVFRRKGRLTLTLITLTLGGAIFASVLTIQASLDQTFEGVMDYMDYDVMVDLQQPVPVDSAIQQAEALDGVEGVEGWLVSNATRIREDETQNSNIWLMAPPASTGIVDPTIVEGQWHRSAETGGFVVNVDFLRDEQDIQLGDPLTLNVEGHNLTWPVVGVVSSQLMGPVVYSTQEPLSDALGIPGEVNRLAFVTRDHEPTTQTAVAELADVQLRAAGLPVAQVVTGDDLRAGTESLFDILFMVLLIIGILLVAVGAIGLMGAMSLNIIERTREIGVMRAIGASNGMVARIVIAEGLTVGMISWALAALLAVPMSWALGYAIGIALLQIPLAFSFSMMGVVLWLALVIVLSILASILPARNAWRLSVREVLAYE